MGKRSRDNASSAGDHERCKRSRGHLTPDGPEFEELLKANYAGVVKETLEEDILGPLAEALAGLSDSEALLHKVTQPLGRDTCCVSCPCAIVGEPGTTYKFNDLRLFSHCWNDASEQVAGLPEITSGLSKRTRKGIHSADVISFHASNVGRLSRLVGKRARRLLKTSGVEGSGRFNASLICSSLPSKDPRDSDSHFVQGLDSIEWQTESCLVDGSSVAVLSAHRDKDGLFQKADANSEQRHCGRPWRFALRVAPSTASGDNVSGISAGHGSEDSVPAALFPEKHGDAYYLLGGFRRHHQHAVLAGRRLCRLSSMHFCVTDEHTYDHIVLRCKKALTDSDLGGFDSRAWREELLALYDIESEWIRQFYIQGQRHYDLHPWWHRPLRKLEKLWSKLETRMTNRLEQLYAVSFTNEDGEHADADTLSLILSCCAVMSDSISKLRCSRIAWCRRELDPKFNSLPLDCRPLPCLPNAADDAALQASLRQVKKKELAAQAAQKGISQKSSDARSFDDTDFLQRWDFDTDYGDHFETPRQAYIDVMPALMCIARSIDVDASALRIYDPYYCTGRMKGLLAKLGFEHVINEHRDFYQDIADEAVPVHDVLLSNPPYSADHKEKFFSYILERQQTVNAVPFLLLLPAWTASKTAWRRFLWCLSRARERPHGSVALADAQSLGLTQLDPELEREAGAFYICPAERYAFKHPDDSGRPEAPFYGIWFCGGWPTEAAREKAIRSLEKAFRKARESDDVPIPSEGSASMREAVVTEVDSAIGSVVRSLKELRDRGLVRSELEERQRQLENPKQRARREAALRKVDAARKADPKFRTRKNAKEAKRRQGVAAKYADEVGSPLTDELRDKVLATPKACRFYFGVTADGANGPGCNMGAKCRFLHTL